MRWVILTASFLVAAGCSTSNVTRVPPAIAGGSPSLLQTLGRACKPLCLKDATAPEVGRAIGHITNDYGGPLQVAVKLDDATFSSAEVLRDGVSRRAVAVWFYPGSQAGLPMGQATANFGPLEDNPRQTAMGNLGVVFQRSLEIDSSCVCQLTAEVHPGAHGVNDGSVTKMILRRGEL